MAANAELPQAPLCSPWGFLPMNEGPTKVHPRHNASCMGQVDGDATRAAGGIQDALPAAEPQRLPGEGGFLGPDVIGFEPEVFGKVLGPVFFHVLVNDQTHRRGRIVAENPVQSPCFSVSCADKCHR